MMSKVEYVNIKFVANSTAVLMDHDLKENNYDLQE